MNSRFEFPRRVRIHGGECGAVARALHHEAQEDALMSYERASLVPAAIKKALIATNERKQMSTKTTLKRIALVAVSALGFGMFTAVAPASAAQGVPTSVVIGTIPQVRVGQLAYIPFRVYIPTTLGATDTVIINAEAVAAPVATASNAASIFMSGTNGDNDSGAYMFLTGVAGQAAGNSNTLVGSSSEDSSRVLLSGGSQDRTAGVAVGASETGPLAVTSGDYDPTTAEVSQGYIDLFAAVAPDVSGTYTIMVSASTRTTASAAAGTLFAAGDKSATATFTTVTAPTGVTITPVGGSTIHPTATNGIAVKIETTGGILAGLESIDLSVSGASGAAVAVASSATGRSAGTWGTTASLPATYFVNGTAYAWLRVDTASSVSQTLQLTATGGGPLSASVTASRTFSVNPSTGSATAMTYQAPSSTATFAMVDGIAGGSGASRTIEVTALSKSQSIGLTFAAYGATSYGYVTVTDTEGLITGVKALVYDVPYSVGSTALGTTLSFAGKSTAATSSMYQVVIPAAATSTLGTSSATTVTVSSAVIASGSSASFVFTPNATFNVAPGTAVAITAELDDRFGNPWANQTVTVATTGRNNPASTTLVTDAAGKVTFTTADTSTSTTQLIDTVTFSASNATSSSVTINYGNSTVGTITVTGGNTSASVTALTTTDNPISVGSSTAGTEAGAITVTATVKDASGNLLAGVPVTFSVAGEGVAFTTTSATKYTTANGTAAGSLYAWKSGTYTYTVTAGDKSTTGTATFASTTPGNTRVVSATVNGNVVTGKAVDRFGNPVVGATLYAVATSPANIGGEFVKTGTTNAKGELSWVVSGSGDVTVTAVNPALAAGTTAYETCQLAGNRTCATASTAAAAYSATVAGTATTAEKFVGSSFAPAGVASVTVKVAQADAAADAANAAADAAAEAIDAANAATDAANLAAEAADAATVAAEEARDAADAATAAVEELATQVATLMAALKAQITTLANTVAKIAKKVRA